MTNPASNAPSTEGCVQESRPPIAHVENAHGEDDTQQVKSADESEIEGVQGEENPDLRIAAGQSQGGARPGPERRKSPSQVRDQPLGAIGVLFIDVGVVRAVRRNSGGWPGHSSHHNGGQHRHARRRRHRQPGPAPCEEDPGHSGSDQGGGSVRPTNDDVGCGELVGRAHDGGQKGGLWWACHRETERGERGQDEHHDGRRAQTDGETQGRHGQCLEPVGETQHAAWSPPVGQCPDEGREGDAGDELDQHHHHARRGSAVTVGEEQQRDPDTEFGRPKQRISQSDSPQFGITERRPEHRQDGPSSREHQQPRTQISTEVSR